MQSEVVHVWPPELVRIQEQEEQSTRRARGERKRRTLEELGTAVAPANRMKSTGRDLEEYESSETVPEHGHGKMTMGETGLI